MAVDYKELRALTAAFMTEMDRRIEEKPDDEELKEIRTFLAFRCGVLLYLSSRD